MKTRSQKLKLAQDGHPPSPPLRLPTPQKRSRRSKKAVVPESRVRNVPENSVDLSSEKPASPSIPVVHPPSPECASHAQRPSPQASAFSPTVECTPIVHDLSALSPIDGVPGSPKTPVIALPLSVVPAQAVSRALLCIWVDVSSEDLASTRLAKKPDISLAIPSTLSSELLEFIAQHPSSHNELTYLTAPVPVTPNSNKRKLQEEDEDSRPAQRVRIEIPPPSTRLKPKGIFARRPLQALTESNIQAAAEMSTQSQADTTSNMMLQKVKRYAEDGSLQLGLEPIARNSAKDGSWLATDQSICSPGNDDLEHDQAHELQLARLGGRLYNFDGDEDENSHTLQAKTTNGENLFLGDDNNKETTQSDPKSPSFQTQLQSAAKTPLSRWGLVGLLKSARSVSKFLPSFTPRMTPAVAHAPIKDASLNQTTTPPPETQPQATAQTEPPLKSQTLEPKVSSVSPNVMKRQDRRRQQLPKSYRSKEEIQASRLRKAKQKSLLEAKAQEDRRQDIEMATTPGRKRKRLESPDTIPNPPGCSYGLNLDYFGDSSSDEEENSNENDTTPTKARPSKSRRLTMTDDPQLHLVGDPQKARPYTGVYFADETPSYHGGNVFGEVSASEDARRNVQYPEPSSPPATPKPPVITNLTGSFRVPDDSDSDSDLEGSPNVISDRQAPQSQGASVGDKIASSMKDSPPIFGVSHTDNDPASKIGNSPVTKSIATTTTFSPSQTATSPNKASETWTQPPPPRPKPSHAALPANHLGDSEALAKARSRALQHKPHKPSGLRESNMISSPRHVSDTSEDTTAISPPVQSEDLADSKVVIPAERFQAARNNETADISPYDRRNPTALGEYGHLNAYEEYRLHMDPKVATFLEQITVDSQALGDMFTAQVSSLGSDEASHAPPAETGPAPAPPSMNSSTDDPQTTLRPYIRDPVVEAYLDEIWTESTTEAAAATFETLYADFKAQQQMAMAAVAPGVAV